MASFIFNLLAIAAALAAGVAAGYMYRKNVQEKKIGRTEEYARNLLDDAQRRAEEKKKESILEAKEEVIRLKNELDREIRDRRIRDQFPITRQRFQVLGQAEPKPLIYLDHGASTHPPTLVLDTYKDAVTLNDLWRSGTAPWLPAA